MEFQQRAFADYSVVREVPIWLQAAAKIRPCPSMPVIWLQAAAKLRDLNKPNRIAGCCAGCAAKNLTFPEMPPEGPGRFDQPLNLPNPRSAASPRSRVRCPNRAGPNRG